MASYIAHLAQDVQRMGSAIRPDNQKQRQSLLRAARALVNELETPAERIARMTQLDTAIWTATRVLIDMRVFVSLVDSDGPKTASQLAETSGADPKLVERLLKLIATENFVHETGPDEYAANDVTHVIGSRDGQGAILDLFNLVRIYADLPTYFRETKYVNPTNKDKTAFKYAYGHDYHYFEWLSQLGNEEKLEAFHGHMRFKTLGLKWFEVAEIMDSIFGDEKLEKDDVLLVDVGGSTGYDTLNFRQAHPNMSGRLILQDLPATINSLDTKALATQGVEAMAHDFFTPEPVEHAKAYYLKMCLHDWPREQCKQILANLKPALKPGYSRILLNEIVIPDVQAGWWETSVDMLMMAVHGSQERKEAQWREMIESVEGLKVRKIWDANGADEKIIEIEVV